jgi:hypothetical protein
VWGTGPVLFHLQNRVPDTVVGSEWIRASIYLQTKIRSLLAPLALTRGGTSIANRNMTR